MNYTNILTKHFTILLACLLMISLAFGQEWYEGTGEVTLANITLEDARNQAFDRARTDALAKARLEVTGVTGRQIKEDSAREIYDNFIQFTSTRTQGLIDEVDTLFDELVTQSFPGSKPVYIYRACIRARVVTEDGKPDPAFIIEMSLNRGTFRDGDTMVVVITASRDCYVTIFNLYYNDSLSVVFPNQLMTDNRLAASDTLFIPPRNAFWDMPVRLAPGHNRDEEALLAVATEKPIPFQIKCAVSHEGLIAQSDALLAVNRWLVQMDADQRTEKWTFYQIVK